LREIERLLDSDIALVEAWVAPSRERSSVRTELDELTKRVSARGAQLVFADAHLIERLSYGDRNAGIVVIAQTPTAELDELSVHEDSVVAVLEGVEKPGNLGAIIRSADG